MSYLRFTYGAMSANKTLTLLTEAFSYEQSGKKVEVVATDIDNRHGVGVLRSRVGIEREATIVVGKDRSLVASELTDADIVLVDEVQFFSEKDISVLRSVADMGVPVHCFGLKVSIDGNLFPASAKLMACADELVEARTVCAYCSRKAIFNVYYRDGEPVFDVDQIIIGGDDVYKSVCSLHYHLLKGEV